MQALSKRFLDGSDFLLGVELVTTRGTMQEGTARQTRRLATELTGCAQIDWVSITDNAGGNPMLSPMALGKNILYGGKEVIIHLSCKDFNRHGLESEAWQLASEGFHNILALSGDYPARGYHGQAKPVFDIDSVGLLRLLEEMNRGLDRPRGNGADQSGSSLQPTNFFSGAVATNFKRLEHEVMPQYLKLETKLKVGAQFVIAQIGFDARKSHEMLVYLAKHGWPEIPLIGNVFLLSRRTTEFFRSGRIPGVVLSDAFYAECEKQSRSEDRGRAFFRELAAQQIAYFRGLGFRGAYLGGVHSMQEVQAILDLEASFAADDWQQFARAIRYPQPGEFYLYAEDEETGLANAQQLSPSYQQSLSHRKASRNVTWGYRLSKWIHDTVFTPGKKMFHWGQKIYGGARNQEQGPAVLRILEYTSKSMLFRCKDCGDCSLPDIAFLCPESQCAKNQRNGPCGGTRDGLCEVDDFPCIWSRAYDRLKYEGREQELLAHAPVIQDESLRGTSSWANIFLGRDHHALDRKEPPPPDSAPDSPPESTTSSPEQKSTVP